jgi:pimeloyl-ACP methyl ester carboxylesterase
MPNIRGVDIAVNDAGSGPAFFWGHGFASCMANEADMMLGWDKLAKRYRVVRWDARGHGQSSGTETPDDYRWENLGLDLIALADSLGIETFVAGGVSMGAATALHAAVQAPDRVTGLALALPPTAYDTRASQGDEYVSGADLVEQQGVAAYVERHKHEPVPEILAPIAEAYLDFVPAIPDALLPAALRGAGSSDLPPEARVREITVPTLLLAWAGDAGHPLSTAELLTELLPNAELNVAGELMDLLSWTDLVEAFLDRVEGDGGGEGDGAGRS